ncbi:MAG: nucleotide sugar dehydrogenase, partial [Candidatus Margulisbacteria bacterium]|nr:nucleotide sugar dehydrogenase [Candidatus Margulisiibacteriota bacterium]
KSYIPDVETIDIADTVKKGTLSATTDFSKLKGVDAVFICVPTPFDKAKAPDLSFVCSASQAVAQNLHKDMIVVLQSTTYPGTTEEVVRPILEKTGLIAGKDFYLGFSPERIDPGNKKFTAKNTAKVVGGTTPEGTELICDLFAAFIGREYIKPVSGPKTAEMCKILENTFRSVNIALVNELAQLSERMEIDIWEVIDAAATKPFGYMPFYPGPGVGGHCIPVDPFYLSWKAREYDFYTKFIELAADVNMNMPLFALKKIKDALNTQGKALKAAKVLVLGAAFKKDIDDHRNSPAMYLMKLIRKENADLNYSDPYVPQINIEHDVFSQEENPLQKKSLELSVENLKQQDCVVIVVAHSNFDYEQIVKNSKLIVDLVNATKNVTSKKTNVVKL